MTEQEKTDISRIVFSANNLVDAIAAYIDKRDEERLWDIKHLWINSENNGVLFLSKVNEALSNLATTMGWEREAAND